MKKVFGIVLLLMLAFGLLSGFTAHATPSGTCGDLGNPVDVSCVNPDPNGAPSCDLWIAPGTSGSSLDGCNNFH